MQIVPAHEGVQTFRFFGRDIRAISDEGTPLFVRGDITEALDIDRTSTLVRDLPIQGVFSNHPLAPEYRGQKMILINESNLYRLIMRSDSKNAFEFQEWVTGTVLPQIRETGSYGASVKELSGAELMAKALIEAQNVLTQKDARIAELEPAATSYNHWKQKDSGMSRRKLCQKLREVYTGMNEARLREHMIARRDLVKEMKSDGEYDLVPASEMYSKGFATRYWFKDKKDQSRAGYGWTFAYYEELVKRFSKTLTPAGQQEMMEIA